MRPRSWAVTVVAVLLVLAGGAFAVLGSGFLAPGPAAPPAVAATSAPVHSPTSPANRPPDRGTPGGDEPSRSGTSAASATAPAGQPPGDDARADVPAGDPVSVRVVSRSGTSLVDASLEPAHLDAAQVLAPDPGSAGWYAEAGWPRPGFPGSSVLVGHVSWNGTPDVFWELPRARPGDHVVVRYSSGDRVRFTVTRSAGLSKEAVPHDRSIWQADAREPELRLITCDPATPVVGGHFEGNWVVWARLG